MAETDRIVESGKRAIVDILNHVIETRKAGSLENMVGGCMLIICAEWLLSKGRKMIGPELLVRSGLRRIRMHDLRHTHATLLLRRASKDCL